MLAAKFLISGFFGPDDVCLNTWVVELCNVVQTLVEPASRYTFDEGEQGQPAFVFRRVEDESDFSINESVLGGGSAAREWQRVRFPYRHFRTAVQGFLDDRREKLRNQAPSTWEEWPREARLTAGQRRGLGHRPFGKGKFPKAGA